MGHYVGDINQHAKIQSDCLSGSAPASGKKYLCRVVFSFFRFGIQIIAHGRRPNR